MDAISEVQVAAGSWASVKAPASAEASVSVGVLAAVEAPVSAQTVPSGTGTSEKGGRKEAAGKKKRRGSKPRGAVSLADLKSELYLARGEPGTGSGCRSNGGNCRGR